MSNDPSRIDDAPATSSFLEIDTLSKVFALFAGGSIGSGMLYNAIYYWSSGASEFLGTLTIEDHIATATQFIPLFAIYLFLTIPISIHFRFPRRKTKLWPMKKLAFQSRRVLFFSRVVIPILFGSSAFFAFLTGYFSHGIILVSLITFCFWIATLYLLVLNDLVSYSNSFTRGMHRTLLAVGAFFVATVAFAINHGLTTANGGGYSITIFRQDNSTGLNGNLVKITEKQVLYRDSALTLRALPKSDVKEIVVGDLSWAVLGTNFLCKYAHRTCSINSKK